MVLTSCTLTHYFVEMNVCSLHPVHAIHIPLIAIWLLSIRHFKFKKSVNLACKFVAAQVNTTLCFGTAEVPGHHVGNQKM